MLLPSLIITFFFCVSHSLHPDGDRNTEQMIIAHGYPCENFTITTPDGYILKLFRIPGPKGEPVEESRKQHRQPVILQHGILCSSDTFLDNENPALGYMLADAGFDVWIGNFRGNEYSRTHVKYNPDEDKEFWEFSIDELIKYDVRANFDLVMAKTGYEKISYIGYSMGGGTVLAAASEDPTFYGQHLRSFVGLSPATSLFRSTILMKIANEYDFILKLLRELGVWEIFNLHDHIYDAFRLICTLVPDVCSSLIFLISDKSPEFDNVNKYDVYFAHFPSGTSMDLFIHIMQMVKREGYFHYRKYIDDPYIEYHFSNVPKNVPYFINSGLSDRLVNYMDGRWLKSELEKSGAKVKLKEHEGFGHLTFVIPSKDFTVYYDTIKFTKMLEQWGKTAKT